jgi:hypothetical protein
MVGLAVDYRFDLRHTSAAAGASTTGAADLVEGPRAVPHQLADGSIGYSGAVTDEHWDPRRPLDDSSERLARGPIRLRPGLASRAKPHYPLLELKINIVFEESQREPTVILSIQISIAMTGI